MKKVLFVLVLIFMGILVYLDTKKTDRYVWVKTESGIFSPFKVINPKECSENDRNCKYKDENGKIQIYTYSE